MKERIFKYLLDAGKGAAADRILRDVLNLHTPNPRASDSILTGFLGQDPRFVFAEGLWHIHLLSGETLRADFNQVVILHLQSPNRSESLQNLRGVIRWAENHIEEFTAQAPIPILRRFRSEIESRLLIVWSSREFKLWTGLLRSKGLEVWSGDTLYLRNLAARVLKRTASSLQQEDLASELDLSPADEERPRSVIQYLNECWLLLLERIPGEHLRNLDSLRAWTDGSEAAVDFSRFTFGPEFLRGLPGTSGVYVMKDCSGAVLYVGKSRNLKRRVSSYFTRRTLRQPKTARIHEQLHSIEVLRTDNEVEALLMEMRLIKQFHPVINLQTEIHERQADRHVGRNLLLFAADAEQNRVMIYFLRDGNFAGRHSASLGRSPSKRLREKIKALFFDLKGSRRKSGEIWEKEIISRWLAANQKRLNYLDAYEPADLSALLIQLRHYLCDPDKLMRKVYYR